MKGPCEYTIKWSREGKGLEAKDIGAVLLVVSKVLEGREAGMGAGKVTIIQRRVTEEAGV